MTPAELDKAWSDLPNADFGQLRGLRAAGLPSSLPVYIAVDSERRRHLLVPLAEGSQPLKMTLTRGLEVKTEPLSIGESPVRTYIQLTCLHVGYHATFGALAADVIMAVLADPSDSRAAVERCLRRWRLFWTVDQSALSREQALGLFGELWFLLRWMPPLSIRSIGRWNGPLGARHDFQWPTASIEVKTAACGSGTTPIHLIESLDQLDAPEAGELFLFSLHVADDSLAANSLPVLVEQINAGLNSDPEAMTSFSERLASIGYNPANATQYTRPLRVLEEELYKVDASFPKLTKASFQPELPPGVAGVSYSLSMAACTPWRIASTPFEPSAAFLKLGNS